MVFDCGTLPVIEFLASIEPASLPLLAVLVFSLSLYPVGLMLGSECSPCCGCSACVDGTLPETITVTLDGLPDTTPSGDLLPLVLTSCYGGGATAVAVAPVGPAPAGPITAVNVTNGGSGYAKLARVEPTVTAGGDGEGAVITVTLTEDADICGLPYWKVTALTIVDGGTGYSSGPVTFTVAPGDTVDAPALASIVTTRSAPTLTLQGTQGTGEGATFTVTVEEVLGEPSAQWRISEVVVIDGGSGYFDNEPLGVVLGEGDVEVLPAVLSLRTQRGEPELQLVGDADVTFTYSLVGAEPNNTYEIADVTVNPGGGGSGYIDGTVIGVILGPRDTSVLFAELKFHTVKTEPTVEVSIFSFTGTGAVITATIAQEGDAWTVTQLTLVDGGQGYEPASDGYSIIAVIGVTRVIGVFSASVDENGTMTAVSLTEPGEYFFDTGVLETVEVLSPGLFYRDTGVIRAVELFYGGRYHKNLGVIDSITLNDGGRYWRDNPAGTPYAATVAVGVAQVPPSNGNGATFTPVIDTTPASPTFGQITGITVTNGGDGYLSAAELATRCCGRYYNGQSYVLRRGPHIVTGDFDPLAGVVVTNCEYTHTFCGVGNTSTARGFLRVTYRGASDPPLVQLASDPTATATNTAPCDYTFTSTGGVPSCGDFAFTALHESGASVTVAPGGDYDAAAGSAGTRSCFICCQGADAMPEEVSVSFVGSTRNDLNGTYVLQPSSGFGGSQFVWAAPFDDPTNAWGGILVRQRPCSTQTSTGFQPLSLPSGDICDACHSQCSTDGLIQYQSVEPGLGGFIVYKSSLDGPPAPTCEDVCLETPQCGPTAAAYVVDGFGTITVL